MGTMPESGIGTLAGLALAAFPLFRDPTDIELADALALVDAAAPQNSVHQLDAWEQLAQVLLCTNEFVFIE